jgi:hypothetical protein
MKYFALRHKPTGRLMPAFGRGSTNWNPEFRDSRGPRLFNRHIDAANSLHWWEGGEFGRDDDGYPELMKSRPDRKGTLEVIEVELAVP